MLDSDDFPGRQRGLLRNKALFAFFLLIELALLYKLAAKWVLA